MNIILYIATSIPAVSLLNNRVTNEKITTLSYRRYPTAPIDSNSHYRYHRTLQPSSLGGRLGLCGGF